jgi:hypothetical protein
MLSTVAAQMRFVPATENVTGIEILKRGDWRRSPGCG